MKNLKEKNGITLIALVISIIILLILAGITVASLTGDNGLIGKSGEAKNATEEAAIKEDLEVNVLASYKKANINYDLLNSKLSNINGLKYKNNLISDTNKITKLPDWVDIKGYKFDILEDGTIEKRPDYEKLRNMYGTVLNGYDAGKDLDETKKIDSWQLLYADEEYKELFFIASNTLPAPQPTETGIPRVSSKGVSYTGSNSVLDFEYGKRYNRLWLEKCINSNKYNNAKAVAYLCDPDNWEDYKTGNAKYAVGAPTQEIIVASFENTQVNNLELEGVNTMGYNRNNITSGLNNGVYKSTAKYWLASPYNDHQEYVNTVSGSRINDDRYGYKTVGLRPVVCFPASVIKIDGENLSV